MKKAIIAIAVLLIAAGGSIAAFMGVKSKSDKETKKEEARLSDYVLFNFDANSINKVDVSCTDGDYTFEYAEEEWSLTEYSDSYFDTNQTAVQSIDTFMSYLQAKTATAS